jgi:biotin operon repressor
MKIYMAVTPDKYELPIFFCESGKELAKLCGVSSSNLYAEISRWKKGGRYSTDGRRRGYRFVSVEIEEVTE